MLKVKLVQLFTNFTEATFALLIVYNSLKKIFFSKVRPQNIGEIKFTVSNLPKEIITDPVLTACTDQQLRTALEAYGYMTNEIDFILQGTWDLTDKFISADYPNFNRKQRKAMEVERLATISANSQSIKYCDLIDNTKSIVRHDRNFARVYLTEKANLLKVMNKGDQTLHELAVKNTLS